MASAVRPARPFFDGPLAALDALRLVLLRLWMLPTGSLGRALIRQPALRVCVGGSLAMLAALLLTWSMPLVLLAVSPLILGVPHLVADVRYLVLQPGYHRRLFLALPVGLGLLGASLGLGMRAGLAATALTLILARRAVGRSRLHSRLRRGLGLLLVAAVACIGWRTDWYWLDLGMAHAHNFIAVLFLSLWLSRRPLSDEHLRQRRWLMFGVPLALFLLISALLSLGWVSARPGALVAFAGSEWLDIDGARWILAPYLDAAPATRVVLLFAFAQAVHYTVWLRLVPDLTRERPTPRSFRASFEALRSDFGRPLLWLAGATLIGLIVYGFFDLAAARDRYFRIALFHGHLELCALALWWIEGVPTAPSRR
jgi:hypothetical protein